MPRSRWVRPRSARWNAWLWQLASPGIVRPGRRSDSPAGRGSGLSRPLHRAVGSARTRDGGEPPVLDRHEHVVAHGAVDPRPLEEVRRLTGQPLEGVGQGLDADEAVGHLGVLVGRVGDAGRVAHEQHRGRDPGGGQDPGVVAGLRSG